MICRHQISRWQFVESQFAESHFVIFLDDLPTRNDAGLSAGGHSVLAPLANLRSSIYFSTVCHCVNVVKMTFWQIVIWKNWKFVNKCCLSINVVCFGKSWVGKLSSTNWNGSANFSARTPGNLNLCFLCNNICVII